MTDQLPVSDLAGGMRLSKWRKQVGISEATCWRLRKTGRLKVVIRYGMVFVTAAEMRRWFEENPSDEPRVPAVPA